jgi:hypothetical protein
MEVQISPKVLERDLLNGMQSLKSKLAGALDDM